MNKRLLVTSTDLMMVQFLLPHIKYLRENGFEVDVGCSDVGGRIDEVKQALGENTVTIIRLVRNPFDKTNLTGLKDLRTILKQKHYDLIWTNEPVMGLMTRLAAKETRKNGTKVIYMTHGYHFFKGCPSKYKLIYPIEKYASRLCDAIITINWEDFELTKSKFHVQRAYHIDGIGFDPNRSQCDVDVGEKRKSIGVPQNAFLVLSVGELKPHKNHKVIVDAISHLNRDVYYVLCGKGELLDFLSDRAKEKNIADKVIFLGYRNDVSEIMKCADVFAFPSIREGLGLASLEAMSNGLPIIASNTRGIRDYVIEGKTGFLCASNSEQDFRERIEELRTNNALRRYMSIKCKEYSKKYDIKLIKDSIKSIIEDLLEIKKEGITDN